MSTKKDVEKISSNLLGLFAVFLKSDLGFSLDFSVNFFQEP